MSLFCSGRWVAGNDYGGKGGSMRYGQFTIYSRSSYRHFSEGKGGKTTL